MRSLLSDHHHSTEPSNAGCWQVAQGWDSTVAVAADEDWLYVVTSTGLMPTTGTVYRIDLEGRPEELSGEDWGMTNAIVVFDPRIVNGALFDQ